jgi:hypothetical protein
MPSGMRKGFFQRAGERQEKLIKQYEEHMRTAAKCDDCGKVRTPPPELFKFDDVHDPDWYIRELAEEETERERRREAGETVSDDEDQVCPGCEAEKRGEKGVPHLSDHFNVPPNKPEEKAAGRFDFNKIGEMRPEWKPAFEQLVRDLTNLRQYQGELREEEKANIEKAQKDWPKEKREQWRRDMKKQADELMAINFGDDTEGREPFKHPETGKTVNPADLDGIGQFLKTMYSEDVPEPFRWPSGDFGYM